MVSGIDSNQNGQGSIFCFTSPFKFCSISPMIKKLVIMAMKGIVKQTRTVIDVIKSVGSRKPPNIAYNFKQNNKGAFDLFFPLLLNFQDFPIDVKSIQISNCQLRGLNGGVTNKPKSSTLIGQSVTIHLSIIPAKSKLLYSKPNRTYKTV